jgi:uncharacterized SAM-binding protein YcdF (DUF218 family)
MSASLRFDALTDAAARSAYTYLSATDSLPDGVADAVIGFGTFDLTLARFCGELFTRGAARCIIFTGGYGAGTADLGQPEADAWADELRRSHPGVPRDRVILENRSTNTAENIRLTAEVLQRDHPQRAFGRGLRTALIVASPARLRRVGLTLRQLVPAVRAWRCLPATSFERERALHDSKGIPFVPHLRGELDRIVDYPRRGWIAAEPLPPAIARAHAVLRRRP